MAVVAKEEFLMSDISSKLCKEHQGQRSWPGHSACQGPEATKYVEQAEETSVSEGCFSLN